ncbi:hypothetical protein [Candidatus Poriferisodalis sp.]|uniref:hypothetical protein n=1 Tax=Candidatus Poriferisodalis sp. TaxID=3101277 RepID=UPI003B018668
MAGELVPVRRLLLAAIGAVVAMAVIGSCATDAGHHVDAEPGCRAHAGPEPADLLDWQTDYDQPHPAVSCVVGDGILAGWWQWHEFSAPDCTYVAVLPVEGPDEDGDLFWSRRNAIEPVQLRAGDVVVGYATVGVGNSGPISSTARAECFLEHIGPEDGPEE